MNSKNSPFDQWIKDAIAKNEELNLEFRLVKLYSVKTGLCAEDCSFCGQSRKAEKEHKVIKIFSSVEDIDLAVDNAIKNFVDEILLVSSGTKVSNKNELKILAEGISHSKRMGLEVGLDLGLMDYDDLSYLFDAGADIYVNAVQTARSFFSRVIGSHSYEDKIRVLESAKQIGYKTRSGGILGVGETERQRYEFASELQDLPCDTIGLSLFQPIKGSVMENHPKMSSQDALDVLALVRNLVNKPVYLLGGREKIISEEDIGVAFQLINGTTVGGYLFTDGDGIEKIAQYIDTVSLNKKLRR